MMSMIVYALVDPRTNRVRYIGKSEKGLIRPLSHKLATTNHAMKSWLYDLEVCGCGYTTLVLAEASTSEHLQALETYWIATGARFSWPLCNVLGMPKTPPVVEPAIPLDPHKRWSAKSWRRDPEVRKALAAARAHKKST